jgi:hypothetical protein
MRTGCCNTAHMLKMESHAICINPGCENYLGVTTASRNYKLLRNTFALSVLTFCMLFTFDDFSMERREEITMPATAEEKADKPTKLIFIVRMLCWLR